MSLRGLERVVISQIERLLHFIRNGKYREQNNDPDLRQD